jgi:hypothetical protein
MYLASDLEVNQVDMEGSLYLLCQELQCQRLLVLLS